MDSGASTRPASVGLRRRVVETALECFGEQGYGAVSIEMICDAAQVSVGSLYHHFDNKAGIAAAVYSEAIRRYHAALIEAIAENPVAADGVRSLVVAHHNWVSRNPDWARFMMTNADLAEIKADATQHVVANQQLIAKLMNWAQPQMDRGRLATFDPRLFVSLLFGPSYFYTRVMLRGSPEKPAADVATQFGSAAWRTLSGPNNQTAR